MNIKEHIEAGHYPTDEKGRALVPSIDGGVATIAAADAPGSWVIMGWLKGYGSLSSTSQASWNADGSPGRFHGSYADRVLPALAPPKPRKVQIRRWVEHDPEADYFSSTWKSDKPGGGVTARVGCVILELTGEYEEPWS